MSRLSNTGTLVASPEPRTSGRVLAKMEYGGSWVRSSTAAGQYQIWNPKIKFQKGHLIWVVGSITLTCPENKSLEMVVWRAGANVEIQKVTVGGGRDSSTMQTTHSVYVNGMFVPDADIEEEIWIALNAPEDSLSMQTQWRKELMPGAPNIHNIYIIDMGPADALVPDGGLNGHRLNNAGALDSVPSIPNVMPYWAVKTTHVPGAADTQQNIFDAKWNATAGHQYLVIAAFTTILLPNNLMTRRFWLYDSGHGANPAMTEIGTYGGPSHNASGQDRPVTLVKVLDGSSSVALYGNTKAGDAAWLTAEESHYLIVLDLGPK